MSRLVLLLVIASACSSERSAPPTTVATAAPAPALVPPADAAPPDAAPLPPDAKPYDLAAQTFDGRPGFLVLGEHYKKYDRALAGLAERYGIDVHVIDTALFSNLRPGFFALVYGRFDDREAAQRHADVLAGQGIDVYVKPSGPVRAAAPDAPAPERLTRIRGEHSTHIANRVELTLSRGGQEMARFAQRWDEYGTGRKFSLWTNLTGTVSIEVSAVCPGDCAQVNCRGDELELTGAGGDVETRAECLDWAGE